MTIVSLKSEPLQLSEPKGKAAVDQAQASLEKNMDETTYPVPQRLLERKGGEPEPHISSKADYHESHAHSLSDPAAFWGQHAKGILDWDKPFTRGLEGSFSTGDIKWFSDGELNASYNCVDRHAKKDPNKVAIIYEADEPGSGYSVTYGQLKDMVCRLANVLLEYGLTKGDTAAIYLPMVPEALASVLACARIGVVHSLVFAGFSSSSLADRINDAKCRVLITADEGKRGGRVVPLKKIADEALDNCPSIEKVLVLKKTGSETVRVNPARDAWWHQELARQSNDCPPIPLNAEHPLFILYTSGSTGTPKGLVHSTGGYLVGAAVSTKYVFDCHEGDIFCCTADIGWITGHTYLTYGPLSLGLTTVVFESVPTYPDASRFWKMVADYKITHFYTAPTAIRSLRRLGNSWFQGHDLSSLRVIASVGEPINPEAWHWYNENVGNGRCAVVDTYWQTETGSAVIAPIPCAIPTKPGSATVPFFGIDAVILEANSGLELKGGNVTGVLALRRPWPSVARTIFNDHTRYLKTYLNVYPGMYFTGDGAHRDFDGYLWIRGRVDDVINVSGHRMSTAEIESSLIQHPDVAEAAVVGMPDDITGQGICAFVTLKPNANTDDLNKTLIQAVRRDIGPFAQPKRVIFVDELPKTRSGKIVRRVLRKIMAGEADQLGDLNIVSDPNIVDHLIQKAKL